ncbi:MAG: hypothetical protein KIC92_09570 [Clostridiales bacterium]|nr:hypothetical protein [Clostridiales bacterium]
MNSLFESIGRLLDSILIFIILNEIYNLKNDIKFIKKGITIAINQQLIDEIVERNFIEDVKKEYS